MASVYLKRGKYWARLCGAKVPGKWSGEPTGETDREKALEYAHAAQAAIDKRNARTSDPSTGIRLESRETRDTGPNQGRHMYLMFCIYTRRCKIGRANDVWSRLAQVQSCSPTPLILWCVSEGTGWLERVMHEAFSSGRLHNEWFDANTTSAIASVVGFGDRQSFSALIESKRRSRT